jgi:hypothetical protein
MSESPNLPTPDESQLFPRNTTENRLKSKELPLLEPKTPHEKVILKPLPKEVTGGNGPSKGEHGTAAREGIVSEADDESVALRIASRNLSQRNLSADQRAAIWLYSGLTNSPALRR